MSHTVRSRLRVLRSSVKIKLNHGMQLEIIAKRHRHALATFLEQGRSS